MIDSNVFVAYAVGDDTNHEKAVRVIKRVIGGDFGPVFTSDYVFDETVTVMLMKSKSLEKAVKVGEYIKNSVDILTIGEDLFEGAWRLFKSQRASKFSFTDCSNMSLMNDKGIRYIATFDKEFKKAGFLEVVD